MDFLGLISSVSRLAIAAFVITLVVVAYEVFLIARRKRLAPVKDSSIAVPEFTGDAKPGTFSPVVLGESAKQPFTLASRKISRHYVYILLVLLVLIVVGAGILIYKRSTLSSPDVKVSNTTPAGSKSLTVTPTIAQAIPGRDPFFPGEATPTVTDVPTESPASATITPEVTVVSNQTQVSPSPTLTQTVTLPLSPTVQSTATPTTAEMPRSGSYQTTLMISLVSIAIIYLALIL